QRVNEELSLSRAARVFENGKAAFRDKKYEQAAEQFRTVIQRHAYSAHVPEALFLLVESTFVLREFDECVRAANKLLDIYPDNELTGYALLRLGKVYEFQDRHEEA